MAGLDSFWHEGSHFYTHMVCENDDIALVGTFWYLHHENRWTHFKEIARGLSNRHRGLQCLPIRPFKFDEVARLGAIGHSHLMEDGWSETDSASLAWLITLGQRHTYRPMRPLHTNGLPRSTILWHNER